MSHFRTDLVTHKKEVGRIIINTASELSLRGVNHDLDKIDNDTIFNIYEEYSERWRAAEFKSDKYYAIKKEMMEAHNLHAAQRHHFYTEESSLKIEDVTLIDCMENLADWVAACGRTCLTKEAKAERLNMMIDMYYYRSEGDETLITLLKNTAHHMIEQNY